MPGTQWACNKGGVEGATGKESGAQGKVRQSELQSSEAQALGAGGAGKGGVARTRGRGETKHRAAEDPLHMVGQGPGEHGEGEGGENKPKLDYLLDFLCAPQLEGRERERRKEKGSKLEHISM